jgi:multimeric flavodoxin WrbA
MHILGICNGSIGGNSEILLKAALVAAQKTDPSTTTSWIHAPSVVIPRNPKPLKTATEVSNGFVDKDGLVEEGQHKGPDDRSVVLNAILNADALIFASPTQSHQPAGTLKAVTDKILGPFADATSARMALESKAAGDPAFKDTVVDERLLKPRVVGFLVVAGSTVNDQITMALPTMHQFVYPLHAKVVDQHVFLGYANPGSVLLHEKKTVMRAEQLGRNIASQMGKSFDEAEYLGEKSDGSCPYCHLDTVQLEYTADNQVGCLTCGARGKLEVNGSGLIAPVWDPDCVVSCITMKGKVNHIHDIRRNGGAERAKLATIKEVHEKWKQVQIPRVPLPSQAPLAPL